MDIKNEIKAYCSEKNIFNIGFIECRKFYELEEFYKQRKYHNLQNEFEEDDIFLRINPNHYMKEGKTIISIAFPYFHGNDFSDNGFSLYTRGQDYHNIVKYYLKEICTIIESHGGKALPFVDSNTLPERYIAALAGIGFIGKNNLLITKEYGSYVFLGEIITDLAIYDEDKTLFEEINNFEICGECDICYKSCPTKAINKNRKNCNICLSYLTQKKELVDWEIKALKGRVFGCDSCQNTCPYNLSAKISPLDIFKPLEFMKIDKTDDILEISNKGFNESFKRTSCGWRGKNILKRNALIRKELFLKEETKSQLSESEYLNKYKEKLSKMK